MVEQWPACTCPGQFGESLQPIQRAAKNGLGDCRLRGLHLLFAQGHVRQAAAGWLCVWLWMANRLA